MKQVLCIGNYSSKGIIGLHFNDGILKPLFTLSDFPNCSYLIQNNGFLYHVVEISKDSPYGSGMIGSYNIKDFSLNLLNLCSSYGDCPCHLTVDSFRNMLYVANYGDGSFSCFKIKVDGSIGNKIYLEKFGKTSHIHYVALSHDNRYLFVIDLGTNQIHAYSICSNPSFSLCFCNSFSFPPHTQPRHLVLDINDRIHVITESSCEIYTLSFKNEQFSFLFKTSLFSNIQKKKENDTGCAIKINKTHKFLYTSIRGQNLIQVFHILENRLNLIQSISCHGSMPRDISFDKDEKYLISANQDSNNLAVFSISPIDGTLAFKNSYFAEKPSCILPL